MIIMETLGIPHAIITYYEKVSYVVQTPVVTQDKLWVWYGNRVVLWFQYPAYLLEPSVLFELITVGGPCHSADVRDPWSRLYSTLVYTSVLASYILRKASTWKSSKSGQPHFVYKFPALRSIFQVEDKYILQGDVISSSIGKKPK